MKSLKKAMNLKHIHNVYFIGIGGIGMSGLARYFKCMGKKVGGYDKTVTKLTRAIEQEGILICYEDDVQKIPSDFSDKNHTLVIYTPAVPSTHKGFNHFINAGFKVHKRAEVLGWISQTSFCFAVAGTHGKTTTSSILAHLLKATGSSITAFLGGISENFGSNFIFEGNDYMVVEADEFDRSFLHLSPNIACITSMDADHLDIYGEKEALDKAFKAFADRLHPKGKLFVRSGLPLEGLTYGIDDTEAIYSIKNISIENTVYTFDIVTPDEVIEKVQFHQPGEHNLLNALVAFAMALQTATPPRSLASALRTFKGIQRRFSYQINTEKCIYIDDYAHHPTEINAVYEAIKTMYPERHMLVIFQPHLYSRTRDFADAFAESLSCFDTIRLLEIYPAREMPIEGISSTWLLSKIEAENKKCISKQELLRELKEKKLNTELVVSLGAGDIGEEVTHIKKALLS